MFMPRALTFMTMWIIVASGVWQTQGAPEEPTAAVLVSAVVRCEETVQSAVSLCSCLKETAVEVKWMRDASMEGELTGQARPNGTETVRGVCLLMETLLTEAPLWNKAMPRHLSSADVKTETHVQTKCNGDMLGMWCMILMSIVLACVLKQRYKKPKKLIKKRKLMENQKQQCCRQNRVDSIPSEYGLEGRLSSESKLPFRDLRSLETIGSGSFKTVYHGKWGANHVAIARMQEGGLLNEARLLERISCHPNLVTFYRWTRDGEGNEYVVMELLPMGSLDAVMRRHPGRIALRQKTTICAQICHAMRHLAAENVMHRDLAARNVLVQSLSPVSVKVTDFGLAKNARSVSEGRRGPSWSLSEMLPMRWVPPEVLQDGAWSEKSDVWAFGVTMWEIFSDCLEPYTAQCSTEIEVMKYVMQGGILPQPDNCPECIYRVMSQCWSFDPAQRPTFGELWEELEELDLEDTECASDEKENQTENDLFPLRSLQRESSVGCSSFYSSIKDML